jgi:hypothetical protein
MLRALFQKLLTAAQQQQQTNPGDLPVGTLTFATPYAQPRYGDVEGIGPVEIDQTGNMIGFSPVERCSAHGETAWIPLERIQNLRLQPFGVGGFGMGTGAQATAGSNR